MRLVLIDLGDGIDHPCAFAGKEVVDIDELPASMDQTADVQCLVLMLLGGIGRQAVGHPLDGRQIGVPMGQDRVEILPRVAAAGEVQADGVIALEAQGRGVHALALGWGLGLIFLDQGQEARTGVVLIDQWLLGAEALQVLIDRIGAVGDLLDQLPLGGIGQRHAQQALERLDTLERQTQVIMGHGQVHLEARIIGFPARLGRHVGNP